MNKKLYLFFMALSSYQINSNLEQPNHPQPEFKDPIYLFHKRDLVEQLKLQQEAEKKFSDQSTFINVVAFLKAQITGEKIAQATGRQVPEIGHDQQRKIIYTGTQTEPSHIVVTFSGKKTLKETVESLRAARVAQNFIINTDGSIHPITAESESLDDALKHRSFAVGVAGKVVDGEYEERDMNSVSLTISVVGLDTQVATKEQEDALIQLVGWLSNKFQIKSYNVVDYGTVALPYGRRKTQENLPWEKLAQKGLTIWPKNQNKIAKILDSSNTTYVVFISSALHKLGYITPVTSNPNHPVFKNALRTFQKHYKCANADGELTDEVLEKLSDLLEQMETINPELKDIWPPAKIDSKK